MPGFDAHAVAVASVGVPVIELAALVIGLLLVGLRAPITGWLHARPG